MSGRVFFKSLSKKKCGQRANTSGAVKQGFGGEPAPGAVFDANVWLLRADLALPLFEVGETFEVWEGGTKAWGRVKQMTGHAE
jgi:hypothetical protein